MASKEDLPCSSASVPARGSTTLHLRGRQCTATRKSNDRTAAIAPREAKTLQQHENLETPSEAIVACIKGLAHYDSFVEKLPNYITVLLGQEHVKGGVSAISAGQRIAPAVLVDKGSSHCTAGQG